MESYATPLPRFSAAIVGAMLVTVALLLLMQGLVRHDGRVPDLVPTLRIVDIVRLPEPEIIEPPQTPARPEEPDPPPVVVIERHIERIGDDGIPLAMGDIDPKIDGPTTPGLPDGEMLPIVKVAPAYPQRAVARGIEGYVLLEFVVDETGRVESPRVIESVPTGIFDQAALRAVLKFKYKPRVLDGAAVRVEGVLHRLTFELNDA